MPKLRINLLQFMRRSRITKSPTTLVAQMASTTSVASVDPGPPIYTPSSPPAVLRSLFRAAVRSVQPAHLFTSQPHLLHFSPDTQVLRIGDGATSIPLADKRCHLVGFGKAVLGMALQMERMLRPDRLATALVSVPIGTLASPNGRELLADNNTNTVIEICEGAADNLPDEAAARTAQSILDRAAQMTADDVLIVLISGGGSALLPLPVPPITIEEKQTLCRQLAGRNASIGELNAVRSALSQTKGGKLAAAARRAGALVTLVLSDVCGDPLDVIASGPTVERPGRTAATMNAEAVRVLQRFEMMPLVPASVLGVLNAKQQPDDGDYKGKAGKNRVTLVIGKNMVACEAARTECENAAHNIVPVIVSTTVCGDVDSLAEAYIRLAEHCYAYRECRIESQLWFAAMKPLAQRLNMSAEAMDRLCAAVHISRTSGRPLCVITGGEPTVRVTGTGVGGRNQELALRVSYLLAKEEQQAVDWTEKVWFLSGGTDGIDGPTTAAGAIGGVAVGRAWAEQNGGVGGSAVGEAMSLSMENNDSYTFYKGLCSGGFHVVTGHTGTNVMDMHFLLIQ